MGAGPGGSRSLVGGCLGKIYLVLGSFLFHSLLPGHHEASNFALLCPFAMMLYLTIAQKQWRQLTMD
jgi:hypothetical protein